MASHFNEKILQNGNRHGHVIWRSHENHPHVNVKTMNQSDVNIKQSQLLTIPKQHSTAHIKASGQYSNILTGGSVDIVIRESSGFGHVNNAFIRFDIRNDTGSDLEMISDASLWINYIELLTPNGTRIQNIYGRENLYEMSDMYHPKEWKVKAKLRLGDKNWKKKNFTLTNGETREVYIDLLSSYLNATGIFLPALKGEQVMRIWFHDDTFYSLISGAVPTMTNLELLIDSAFMTDIDFRDEMLKYRSQVLDFRYPYPVRQVFTQSMQPNSTFDFILSGFNGLFTELRFSITVSNPVGNDVKTYYRIQDFELRNQNGVNIQGGSVKTHEESQYIDYPKHYSNDQNLHLNLYRYSFSMDPVAMVERGQVAGFLPLNGRDQLRIRTGDAEVAKVLQQEEITDYFIRDTTLMFYHITPFPLLLN